VSFNELDQMIEKGKNELWKDIYRKKKGQHKNGIIVKEKGG